MVGEMSSVMVRAESLSSGAIHSSDRPYSGSRSHWTVIVMYRGSTMGSHRISRRHFLGIARLWSSEHLLDPLISFGGFAAELSAA